MDVDARDGRIYLPKAIREKFGERYELVDRGDRLVLIPVADDPLSALREEVSGTEKSATELADEALTEGLEEAGR